MSNFEKFDTKIGRTFYAIILGRKFKNLTSKIENLIFNLING